MKKYFKWKQERYGQTGESSAKNYEGNDGTGASPVQGKNERAVAI